MKKHNTIIPALLGLLLLFVTQACKSGQATGSKNNSMQEKPYQKAALEKFGEGAAVSYNFNQNKTHVICSVSSKSAAEPFYRFIVFKQEGAKILLEKNFQRGNAAWADGNTVEFSEVPGAIPPGNSLDDFTYLFDVKTGKTSPKKKNPDDKKGSDW